MKKIDLHGDPAIRKVAWIATLGVDLFVLGSGLWIIGADGDAALQFASFAGLLVLIKAIAWSSGWKGIGILGAVLGIFFFMAYGVMHYELAIPLTSEIVHGTTWEGFNVQLQTNLTQLTMPDLSKESRVALLASNTNLNALMAEETAREILAMKPHLTTRHLFSSMVGIFGGQADAAKILCVAVFGAFGVLLELTVYRITPRMKAERQEVPAPVQEETVPEEPPVQLAYTSVRPEERPHVINQRTQPIGVR